MNKEDPGFKYQHLRRKENIIDSKIRSNAIYKTVHSDGYNSECYVLHIFNVHPNPKSVWDCGATLRTMTALYMPEAWVPSVT